MTDFSNSIIPDTLGGALILSVFDFIACFFVLYFISFFIKGITFLDKIIPLPKADRQKKEE